MTSLIDTNLLVYQYDHRFPSKQSRAVDLLRQVIAHESAAIPYQAVIEFLPAVTRPLATGSPGLLDRSHALRDAEELLSQFEVYYPTEGVIRVAIRAVSAYQLSWFDAHIWAYAEHYGCAEIVSEDFADRQMIGSVKIRNPFK